MAKKPQQISEAGATQYAKDNMAGAPKEGQVFERSDAADFMAALNYLGLFFDPNKDSVWVGEAMRANGFTDEQSLNALKSGRLTPTVCIIAQLMVEYGNTMPADVMERWKVKVRAAAEIGKYVREENYERKTRRTIAEKTQRKALAYTGEIDGLVDDVLVGKVDPKEADIFALFKELGIKSGHCKHIIAYYTPQVEDLEYLLNEHDETAKSERKTLQRMLAFKKEIIETAQALGNAEEPKEVKGSRTKPFKRKVANPTTLKYMAVDPDSKLTSIKPVSILGAQLLVTYNPKYRVLTIYRAASPEGLSIKGTSILNYDETTSESKRAGRAIDSIKVMAEAPKTTIAKLFNNIKSEPIPVRSRTSEDVVLVRVIK